MNQDSLQPQNNKGRKIFYGILVVVAIVLAVVIGIMIFTDKTLDKIQYETNDPSEEAEVSENLQELESLNPKQTGVLAKPLKRQEDVLNVLLVGSDNQGSEINGRADAIILCTINRATKKIHLSSLMRAIYVSIPNDPDPELAQYWSPYHALNSSHSWGGSRLLLKTVRRNFRVDVQRYLEVDFSGFIGIIDELGGVPINLSEAEAAHLQSIGHNVQPGLQVLDGKTALAYARIRKIDSDFVRTSRQRNVLEAVFEKLNTAPAAELLDYARNLLPYLKTNFSKDEIKKLIRELPEFARYSVDQLMLPLEEGAAMTYINGKELYDIDWDSNIEALHQFMEK